MAIRIILMSLFTYVPDVGSWGIVVENYHTGLTLYEIDGYFYPPIWGYVLAFDTWFIDSFLDMGYIIGIPESHYPYETDMAARIPSVAFSIFVKIIPVFTDLALAYSTYYLIGKFTEDAKKQVLGFAAVMFFPITILVSSVGGMFDNLAALFLMTSLIFLKDKKYELSGISLAVAGMTKFFPFFAVIPIIAFLMTSESTRKEKCSNAAKFVLGLVVTSAIILLPQIINGEVDAVFHFITYRLYDNGNASEITDKGQMVLAVFAAGLVVLCMISIWVFKKTQNKERTLYLMLTMGMMALMSASFSTQYVVEVFPLIVLCSLIYRLPLIRLSFVIAIPYTIKLFLKTPVLLYPLAHDTDLVSYDTITNLTSMLLEEGALNTVYELIMEYAVPVQLIIVAVMLLIILLALFKNKGEYIDG